jgi:beta-galactosidase GanA
MAPIHRVYQVNGQPFFPLGGQSINQAGANPAEAETAFRAVKALHGNTLLIPVYWEYIEPQEHRFDFRSVDALIASARHHGLRLILLWFATWKNGNMDYAPAWVKENPSRFQRVIDAAGEALWVLSSHCAATRQADTKAFMALCAHLRDVDAAERTVIGLQIVNEPGILGSDRDYAPTAQAAFLAPVPAELVARIEAAGAGRTHQLWQAAGALQGADWAGTFGLAAAELFTAWSIAHFIEAIAAAGKAVYDLPMHVNVWLDGDWPCPGNSYPSGGAVRNTVDLYRWFAPHVDLIAPDIYTQDSRGYESFCVVYARPDNPFYVPESSSAGSNAWLMFRAIGDYGAIGYHCFAVERIFDAEGRVTEQGRYLAESFRSTAAALPLLLTHQGTGHVHTVVQEENMAHQVIEFDGYVGKVIFGHPARRAAPWQGEGERGRGLIIQAGRREFYLVGGPYQLVLRRRLPPYGTLERGFAGVADMNAVPGRYISADEGHFDADGRFVVDRHRNGDDISRGAWSEAGDRVVRLLLAE